MSTVSPPEDEATTVDASAVGAVGACGGEPVVLDNAVLRSWSDEDQTIVLSLLVPSAVHGFRAVRLRYTGARVLDRNGGPLEGLPLGPGRRYVLRGDDRRRDDAGCHHTLRFFPAPEFTISADQVSAEG